MIYSVSKAWPREELFGLTSQVRRAAVSTAANIAEDQGRNGDREFVHHLGIAHGSLCEVETMVIIAARQGYLSDEQKVSILNSTARVASLISGLMKSKRPA